MTLLGILLALALERLLSQTLPLGRPTLPGLLISRAGDAAWLQSAWAPPLLLAIPVLLTGYAALLIHGPLLQVLLSVVILVLCLGPRDLTDDVRALMAAREAGDQRRSDALAQTLLHSVEDYGQRRSLLGALFVQSHERLFGVLLWFFLLGPAGAVLYRTASRLPRIWHEIQPGGAAELAAMRLHAAAAWWTARVVALLFGLSGSLDDALAAWRRVGERATDWRERTWDVLAGVAVAALSSEPEDGDGPALPSTLDEVLREVLALQNRALLILLAAFAAFTAGGFIV